MWSEPSRGGPTVEPAEDDDDNRPEPSCSRRKRPSPLLLSSPSKRLAQSHPSLPHPPHQGSDGKPSQDSKPTNRIPSDTSNTTSSDTCLLSPRHAIPFSLRSNPDLFASLFQSYPLDMDAAVAAMNRALVELWKRYAEVQYNSKVIAVRFPLLQITQMTR